MLVGNGGNGCNIADFEGGIGRGLEPDEFGARGDGIGYVLGSGGIDIGDGDAKASKDVGEEAKSTAIDIIDSYYLIARAEELDNGIDSGEAAGEGEACGAVLECGDEVFECGTGGIVAASIVEALVNAGSILDEGGCLVDGN